MQGIIVTLSDGTYIYVPAKAEYIRIPDYWSAYSGRMATVEIVTPIVRLQNENFLPVLPVMSM